MYEYSIWVGAQSQAKHVARRAGGEHELRLRTTNKTDNG